MWWNREDSLEHTESLLYRWGDRVSSVLGKEAMVGMYRYQGGRERVYLPDRPETVFMRKSCLHLRRW